MNSFLLEKHRNLPAYVPGDHEEGSGFIRLNTNESPYPPSPGVKAAIAAEIRKLNCYNDPDCTQARCVLAGRYGVSPTQVMVTNGSDEALFLAFLALADADHPIAMPDITYGYYDLFAASLGIPIEKIPLRDDFTLDFRDYQGIGKMIVFPNPNAPTGYAIPLTQIAAICGENTGHVVLVDEAYADFGAQSALALADSYPNLLIVRTFSKSRSLAGARIGFAIAQKELIAALETIRNAVNLYSVSRMAQAAAVAAIREDAYYMDNCERIIKARGYITRELRTYGFEVLDSLGNFVFARPSTMNATSLKAQLRAHGMLVRHWNAPRIGDYLRITIGTMQEMQKLMAAIKMIFGRARA